MVVRRKRRSDAHIVAAPPALSIASAEDIEVV